MNELRGSRQIRSLPQIKRLCVLLWVLVLAGVTYAEVAAGESPSSPPPTTDEDREERDSKPKRSPSRLLELPTYILEIPWYPIKHALNFIERTDLTNRVMDLFYFNEERTAGWFPNFSSSGSEIEGLGFSVFHHDLLEKKQYWSEVAAEIEKYVHAANFSVVENFVGHGIGREMHEDPQLPNFTSKE